MSHGPIFLWQLIYQAKTDVVNLGRPETVSVDRWLQPLSLPVPRILPVALQSTTTFTAVIAAAASVDGWGTQLSTPQRQLLGLRTAQQQFFAYDPAVFVPLPNSWWTPFVEVPKVKPSVAWQQYLAFDAAVFVPSIDGWGAPLSEPPKPKASLAAAAQQFLATSLFFTAAAPPIDSWGGQLSIPQRRLLGLPATQQQFLAYTEAAPFAETVSEDRWHEPWAEPVRAKPALPASEQQAVAFVPVVATQVFEDSWHQRWTDPIQISLAWKTGDNSVEFVAGQSPTPTIDGWGSPWSMPPKAKWGTTAALQQFLAFAPFVTTAVPSVDGWAQPWSTPPKLKVSINVATQQALAFDPAVFVPPVDGWQRALAEPVRIQPRLISDAIFFPPNFTAATVPPLDYFLALSEPQRQLAGLAARFQQDAAYGFVPIVQAFIFFFGNEEPLPWPGFRANQFIRENYDSAVLPPFPIPNPPQTQAKFTVSGPSVSDLFPVSGVVYPYAPETRKTVP